MFSLLNFFKSFFLALSQIIHPRILWIGFKPLFVVGLLWIILLFVFWERGVELIRLYLLDTSFIDWFEVHFNFVSDHVRSLFAPFLLALLSLVLIFICLLLYASFLTVDDVMKFLKRSQSYRHLIEQGQDTFWQSLTHVGLTFIVFILCFIVMSPLWLIPGMMLVLLPVLFGWLSMRLVSYDVLGSIAHPDERKILLHKYRWVLIAIGVATGYLSVVPALLWFSGTAFILLFPFFTVLAIWLYSLCIVFTILWFGHFLLLGLRELRSDTMRVIHE